MKKVLASLSLAALSVGIACEPPPRTIDPGKSPVSGALAVTRDNEHILIADEDRDQLLVLDRATKAIQSRVPVGDAPGHVVELSDGTAAVTTRYGNSVVVVDVARGEVSKSIQVGVEPFGLTELADGRLAVVLAGEAAVALVDIDAGTVTKKTQLSDPDPRAVAAIGDTLYVTHMSTGSMSKLAIDGDVATRLDVATRNDFGPRVIPEHLRSLTVDDETGSILVAHSQANSDTVRAPIDEPGVPEGGECSGYGGCPATLGAVVPGLTELDTDTDTVVVPQPGANQNGGGNGFEDCFDCGFPGGFAFSPNPPSILNPFESRFSIGNGKRLELANPAALALFDGGRGQIVVNLSSKNALLLKRDLNGTASDVIASVKLGNGAQSIALSQDGAVAYVWNQFDMTLSEIELPQVADGIDTASKFVPDAQGNPVADAELSIVPELAATTIALDLEEALDAEAAVGRIMFHDATDSRISANATVACASCHPDGRTDGRTWLFVFGPRNTPQLGGDILDTAPFHWPGDVTSVADLNRMTVLPFMGGSGLDAGSFEYVAKFIGTIRAAPSVVTARGGELTEQERRGEAIFNSEATECSTCHTGGDFTNNLAYDVQTKSTDSRFQDITTFQTPVLHGLNRSAPYLHDGSQKTLEDVIENIVATDKMGKGSHLTAAEKADLVAYLKTL